MSQMRDVRNVDVPASPEHSHGGSLDMSPSVYRGLRQDLTDCRITLIDCTQTTHPVCMTKFTIRA
jgi:hypothetical protein